MTKEKRRDHRNDDLVEAAENCLPNILMFYRFADRHGFWGGAVFAGFHKAPRSRCRSRNSLWPSKLSAPIFRQPTSVQQSLLPFPRP